MKKILVSLIYGLISVNAWAISESNFAADYSAKVEPFYNKGHFAFFQGVGKKNIAYGAFVADSEKGAIVIVPGRAEPFLKYRELIYDLGSRGYSVYIYDHRGQGYSDRLLANHQVGYVFDYDDYVDDLHTFIIKIVNARKHKKVFLLAHSMGGAIAALYIEGYSETISAAVLTAPMFEMNLGDHSLLGAWGLITWEAIRGHRKDYAPGTGPFDWNEKFEDPGNTIGSRTRFDETKFLERREPMSVIGGPSYWWVGASLMADNMIAMFAANLPTLDIPTPILMFQAGKDTLVKAEGQNYFLDMCRHCTSMQFPTSKHEIFQDVDAVRDRAIEATLSFFESH